MGANSEGNPFEWSALHSELSGHRDRGLMTLIFFGRQNANWTFLWTRTEGDTSAYKLSAKFSIKKDFAVPVQIEYGFDEVCARVQQPWPDGFWVSQESHWQIASDQSPAKPGEYDLQTNVAVEIPPDANRVYIRIRSLDEDPEEGKTLLIKEGEITFEK